MYINLAYYDKTHIKIFWLKFELRWFLVGQLAKLFITLAFSINFKSQIENKVSDYRLLWASRLYFLLEIGLLFHSRFSNSVLSLMENILFKFIAVILVWWSKFCCCFFFFGIQDLDKCTCILIFFLVTFCVLL